MKKNFYDFRVLSSPIDVSVWVIMFFGIVLSNAQAQNSPALRAGFGLEGDLYANKRDFGTFMATNSNDWFRISNSPAGNGIGLIDTAGTAATNLLFSNVNNRNYAFNKGMAYKRFSVLNNRLYLDAKYIRDFHKTDYTAYITSNKNGQNPMVWQGGQSQVLGKNDIMDGYCAFARGGSSLTDSLWMFGALSIIGTNGSRYFDMEFYQTNFQYNGTSGAFDGVGPDAGHTSWVFDNTGKVIQMGDFIVASTFDNFGISNLGFRIWVSKNTYDNVTPNGFKFNGSFDGASNGATFGYATIVPNGTNQIFFLGSTNTGNTQAPPWGMLDQQSNLCNNYSASQFLEFGINFTRLGVDPALVSTYAVSMPCRNVASALVIKSRTSHSFTSNLVDFLGPLDLRQPPITPNAGPDKLACYDRSLPITATFTNLNEYNAPLIAWTADMGGTIQGATNSSTITALTPGRYIVSVSRFGGCEIDGRDTVWVRSDRDCDNVMDVLDMDDDNDGIKDTDEIIGSGVGSQSDPAGDADGDGIANYKDPDYCLLNVKGVCNLMDLDGDGIINSFDLDNDNDGVVDLVEAGGVDMNGDGMVDIAIDVNGNGLYDRYDVLLGGFGLGFGLDSDGDTKYNHSDLDSDGDGISDLVESGGADSNGDGRVDGFLDLDKDGIHDHLDTDLGNDGIGLVVSLSLVRTGADLNNDGKADSYFKDFGTFDNDKLPNFLDLDSDDDGITDIREVGGFDVNNDGRVDNFIDTDGDGWADLVDGDADNNGAVENLSGVLLITPMDANQDGRPDQTTVMANVDKSGNPNPYDLDSDNDGIVDLVEAGGVDMNGDGTIDATTDLNGNGLMDKYDFLVGGFDLGMGLDTDGDGKYNPFDLDSDNDGISDLVESGGADTNGDGRVDAFTDLDKDGIHDYVDTDLYNDGIGLIVSLALVRTGADLDNDGRPDSYINDFGAFDNDKLPNFLDLDSDNDGNPDIREVGGLDMDNDGMMDNFSDADGDGWANSVDGDANNDGAVENFLAVLLVTPMDADQDGRPDQTIIMANFDKRSNPNPYDIDSDDDGILDTRETGIGDDLNFDGITDSPDNNQNGWSDLIESYATLDILNSDGRGNYDFLDTDSDDDGIPDNIEGQTTFYYVNPSYVDVDKDGLDDAYDNNTSVFGGNGGNGITPWNTDGDIIPDYLDEDADSDSFVDREEGWDTDGNGVIDNGEQGFNDTDDTDGDGMVNAYDRVGSFYSVNNATSPYSYPNARNQNPERDWRYNAPLPVNLTKFTAMPIGEAVLLRWVVNMEKELSQYEVERSEDGSRFQKIGAVKAESLENYQFSDNEPMTGRSFYRLRMLDLDGKQTFSKIVEVNMGDYGMIAAYPNPASSQINLSMPPQWLEEGVQLMMTDASGRVVLNKFVEGSSEIGLDTRELSEGVYLLKAVCNGFKTQAKIVIAR